MPALPFALAASFLVWFSFAGGEGKSIVMLAFAAPWAAAMSLCLSWNLLGLHQCKSARVRWINVLVGLACLAVFVSVPKTHWPLRTAFAWSRPSLEAVASDLRSGKQFKKPIQVGLFAIEKAEVDGLNGKVCLWTDLNPSGRTGFTKCPPKNVPFNLWSMITLDSDWQYISED